MFAMWWKFLCKSTIAILILNCCWLASVSGQAYLAPANMGIVVGGEGDTVEAIPGHNPNMAPWFGELDRPARSRGLPPEEQTANGPVIDRRPGDFLIPEEIRKARKERMMARKEERRKRRNALQKEKKPSASDDDSTLINPSEDSTDLRSQTSVSTDLEDEVDQIGKGAEIVSKRPKFDYEIIPRGTPVNKTIGGLEAVDDLTGLEDPFRPRPAPQVPGPRSIVDARIPEIYITNTVTMKLGVTTLTRLVPTQSRMFSSCVYGCDTISYERTLVTILPMRLPCSLISCPPCPTCVASTVKVSVCPFITTVTPPGTTSLVNGPTITIVRSTVTRTACTLTKTVTLKPCRSGTCHAASTATGWNAGDVDDTFKKMAKKDELEPFKTFSSMEMTIMGIISAADPLTRSIPVDSQSEEDDGEGGGGGERLVGEKIRFDRYPKHYRDLRHLIKASQVGEYEGEPYYGFDQKVHGITVTTTITTTESNNGVRTTTITTTTMLPMTRVDQEDLLEKRAGGGGGGGVCSTFIICNPTQFTCPAQITHAPQLVSVVQSILDAQQLYGTAVVEPRPRSPNGAFLDEHGRPADEDAGPMRPVMGPLGDGSGLAGGFNAEQAFGPGGIFAKAMGILPLSSSSSSSSRVAVSISTTTATVTGPTSTVTVVAASKGKAHRAGVTAVASSGSSSMSSSFRFLATSISLFVTILSIFC